MTKPLLAILLLASHGAISAPQDPFNKPVSINWWQASCKEAYVTDAERGYAKGYCDGVMLAYMNELEQWCVPDDVSWGEVQDYVGTAIAEATIKPSSQIDIGDWITNALVVKWPCEVANTSGVVTDPELIEKLNAKRDAQTTEATQEEPESQQPAPVNKSLEKSAEEAPEKDMSRTSETDELAKTDEEQESLEIEVYSPEGMWMSSISQFSPFGIELGFTMEQIHARLNSTYRENREPSDKWFGICEERGNVKFCVNGAPRYGGRYNRETGGSLTIMMYEGILMGMQWDGHVNDRAKFAQMGELWSSVFPPTKATEKEVSWQEGNFMMSITWGAAPKLVMLDTEAFAKSQN